MAFSGCIALRVIHTSTRSCDTAAAIRTIQVRVLTRNVLDVSILQYNPEKKMRKNTLRYLIFCYMVYTRLRVILVAEHRYVPFFLCMVRLGVIHTLVGRES